MIWHLKRCVIEITCCSNPWYSSTDNNNWRKRSLLALNAWWNSAWILDTKIRREKNPNTQWEKPYNAKSLSLFFNRQDYNYMNELNTKTTRCKIHINKLANSRTSIKQIRKKKSKIFNKKINKYWGKETENAKQEAANKTNKQQSDKQCVWLCIVSKIKKWRGKSTFL